MADLNYQGNLTEIAIIKETTEGTTPSTPAFQKVNYTDESLTPGYENTTSNLVRSNRSVADVLRTGQSPAGGWNTELTFGADTELLLESALGAEFSGNILVASDQSISFTAEKKITDGTTPHYFRWEGAKVNTFNFSADATNGVISASVDTLGRSTSDSDSIIAGATYTAPPAGGSFEFKDYSMTAFTELTNDVCVLNFDLNINNNMRTQKGRCTDDTTPDTSSKGVAYGQRQITGTMTVYYSAGAKELYNRLVSDLATKLQVVTSDGTNSYTWTMSKVKFTEGPVQSGGNDNDVIVPIAYQAIFAPLPATWQAGTYNAGDEVEASNNNVYRAKTTTTDDPAVDPTDWTLIGVDTDYNTDIKVEKA